MSQLRVLIAGGGTGGHIIPALAVARELEDHHGAEVLFVGTPRGLESRLVPNSGFKLQLIKVGQLNRVSLQTQVRTLLDLPLALGSCMRLLWKYRPGVVLSVGGYASDRPPPPPFCSRSPLWLWSQTPCRASPTA